MVQLLKSFLQHLYSQRKQEAMLEMRMQKKNLHYWNQVVREMKAIDISNGEWFTRMDLLQGFPASCSNQMKNKLNSSFLDQLRYKIICKKWKVRELLSTFLLFLEVLTEQISQWLLQCCSHHQMEKELQKNLSLSIWQ